MRRSRGRNRRWAAVIAAAVGFAIVSGRALAAEPLEKLVPDGSVAYVYAKDVPQLTEKVKACPTYKLFTDPAMQKAVASITEQLKDPRAELARIVGRDPAELQGMLGGQLCMAIFPRGDRDAHWLVLADVTKDPKMAQDVVQSLLKDARESERYAVKEDTFRGRTVYAIEPVKKEEPKEEAAPQPEGQPGDPTEEQQEDVLGGDLRRARPEERQENPGYITLDNGILAMASSPDRSLIEKHLTLRDGGDLPSLGGSPAYRRLDSYMGSDRDVTFVVNIRELAKSEAAGMTGLDIDDLFGSGEMGSFGCGLTIEPDGSSVQGLVLAPAPTKGILRAFAPQGGSVLPPAYVDKAPGLFGGLRFSMPVLWQEIMAELQREHPNDYTMFQQGIQQMPVDLENGIIKPLGDRWFFYVPPLDTGDLQFVLCVDLQDSAAFGAAFEQLIATESPFGTLKPVDFEGVKLYQFATGGGDILGAEEQPAKGPCVAILQDKFLFATSLDTAKTVINNSKRSSSPVLAEADFQKLLGRTTDSPDAVLLVDGRLYYRWAEAAIKAQREMYEHFRQEYPPGEETPPEPEFPELPPRDVVEKYLSTSIVTAKWVEDGLLIKAWAPNPAQ